MGTIGSPGPVDVWQASIDALPLFFKRKACHYYPDIPTFRIGTLNHGTGGLGALKPSGRRYAMTRENLKALMGKSDIVFSQETKFQTRSYLESFAEWKAFPTEPQRKDYEEGDEVKEHWKVGGIIWIRKSVLKNFEDPETVEIEEGYVHYVVLRPKRVVNRAKTGAETSSAFQKLKLHPSVCGTMSRALRYTPLVEVPNGKCKGLPNDEFQI